MADTNKKSGLAAVVALFLAWLVPGLGHIYVGRNLRGVIIFLAIGATFWAGVAMGGVMTVDYHNERWWFTAQMFTGIHGLTGWQRQRMVYSQLAEKDFSLIPPTRETRSRDREKWALKVDKALAENDIALVAPTSTIARAYGGVAGLLNLMCMFDAVMLAMMGKTGEPKIENKQEVTG